jgi:branched-chain amino acid aminotransferase
MGSGTETGGAAPFGTIAAPYVVTANVTDGVYDTPQIGALADIRLHPFAHALHYGSSCFEGLKAHAGSDGVVRLFRPERHIARMQRTAEVMMLPAPPTDMFMQALHDATFVNKDVIPDAPGALYLRPLLLGTEPNIGAAASPSATALFMVLASPVGEYFRSGGKALKLLVETETPRTTPQFGEAKAGANYVMALGVTKRAQQKYGVDQVLFAPDGHVQETGAANFLLIDDSRIVTRALDQSFLHGVTRDSVLRLAASLGYTVEERDLTVQELVSWRGEAALAGTAAVLAGVGTLVVNGAEHPIGSGETGPNTLRLREALLAIQRGEVADSYGWTVPVIETAIAPS